MLICKRPKIFDVDLYGLASLMCISGLAWLLLIKPVASEVLQLQEGLQQNQNNKQSIQSELKQLENIVQEQRALTPSYAVRRPKRPF